MDIKCTRYPYLWGKKLMVAGREIAFDDAGISKAVDPTVAQVLLRSGGYVDVTLPEPVVTRAPATSATSAGKRAKQVVAGS